MVSADSVHFPDSGPPSRVPAECWNQDQPLFQPRPWFKLPTLETESKWLHRKECRKANVAFPHLTCAVHEVNCVFHFQTPAEHEAEMGIKSKEARKYIFNCLDDMMQVELSGLNVIHTWNNNKVQFLNVKKVRTIWGVGVLCFMGMLDKLRAPAGEHDEPGGHRHPGWEGRQTGVHRPTEEDADAGRRQEDHAHEDPEPPFCYHDTPAALPSQLPVRLVDSIWIHLYYYYYC